MFGTRSCVDRTVGPLETKPQVEYNLRYAPGGRSILVGLPISKAGLKIRRGPYRFALKQCRLRPASGLFREEEIRETYNGM